MDIVKKLARMDYRLGIDFFRHENRKFERDVETVVLGSLNAGIKSVRKQLERASAKCDERLKNASPEQEDWIVDDFIDVRADHEDQERFLRNIAVVALLSRLTHTMNKLAYAGSDFGPRDPKGYEGENEFQKLWREYRKRFGIIVPPKHIQWIEPLRNARNRIVHYGGEANPIKPYTGSDAEASPEVPRDWSFSTKYPLYVDASDWNAEVRVTEQQLAYAAKKAVELTTWLAGELRARQLKKAEETAAAKPSTRKKSARPATSA
jgi:hypothetical protein